MKGIVKEVRCPEDPRRLFMKLIQSGEPYQITESNLIEFSCQNCKKVRNNSGEVVSFVLHRYNLLGDLVETVLR